MTTPWLAKGLARAKQQASRLFRQLHPARARAENGATQTRRASPKGVPGATRSAGMQIEPALPQAGPLGGVAAANWRKRRFLPCPTSVRERAARTDTSWRDRAAQIRSK